MTEEDRLIKLFSSIRTFKNFSSICHHLDDILDTLKQKSISELHPCSHFLIEILERILSNDELKPNWFWFGNLNSDVSTVMTTSEPLVPFLKLNSDPSFFELKFFQTNPFNQKFEFYRLNNQYTDLTIKVANRVFPAHRIVLQDSCLGWNELLKGNVHKIDLTNHVDGDIFDELLTFFYTSKVTVTLKEAPAFCSAFKFFNIPEALNKTEEYLCENIKIGNSIELYFLSERLKMTDLKLQSMKVIVENLKYVLLDTDNCDVEELKMLFYELNSVNKQETDIRYKEDMFHALVNWTKVDPSTRGLHVPELLKLIPESELSNDFLKQSAVNYKFSSTFCKRYLNDFEEESQSSKSDPETLKWPTYKLFCLGGYDDFKRILNSVSCYDFDTGEWTLLKPMDTSVAHAGGVAVGEKIYLCGGLSTNGQALDTFQSYDCTNDTWNILPDMPEPRWMCAVAVIDGDIYVSGGMNDQDSVNFATVFRYCIKTGVWKTVSSMHDCRSSHQLVSLSGYLYAIGGYCKDSFIEQYDPNRDEWTVIQKVVEKDEKRKLCYAGSVLDGKIYICGDDFFEEYTPNSSDPWRSYSALNGNKGMTLISYGDKLFALGGGLSRGTANVMKFDGQWRQLNDMEMNVPRKNHCSFVVRC